MAISQSIIDEMTAAEAEDEKQLRDEETASRLVGKTIKHMQLYEREQWLMIFTDGSSELVVPLGECKVKFTI